MDLDTALNWAAERHNCVLITLRRDGRAQSSDVSYALADGVFSISVTGDRAKTANTRRDGRVVLHITDPASWSYLSFDGTVDLMPEAKDATDETVEALVEYYRSVAGEHDDWDEYRRAMIADKRLIVRFTPNTVVGQIH